ncbi:MAG: cation/acetate symporter ActP [Alphaproteobacteria bacterium]|nr:MAG: cation/acetate symporter ActP [Alphaproteobacteria bacterium]
MMERLFFLATVALTIAITIWAARRVKGLGEFYAAGRRIAGWQNGLAIAGDFLSAATFLGIVGLVTTRGFDAIIYILAPLAGLALILVAFAEPLRKLGRYTLADVVAVRLGGRSIRALLALSTLAVSFFYLLAQMVGAGSLIEILFDIDYPLAVVTVGVLMVFYVAAGGMLATTWVQIVKAVLLILAVTALGLLALHAHGFSLDALYRKAGALHPAGLRILAPGNLLTSPFAGLSLAAGLVFGLAGLPHLMIRFFTVPDARAARQSVLWAGLFIGIVFFFIFFVIGYATIVHVLPDARFHEADGGLRGGANMAAVHLAFALGGPVFYGVIAAVAFATILAVVAGLTLASAGAIAHDLLTHVWRRGEGGGSIRAPRLAAVMVGLVAVAVSLLFEGQNIAYMIALAFAIAAGANFPLLLAVLYWPRLTGMGAVLGMSAGLVTALVLVVGGPAVWVSALGHEAPLFEIAYPAPFAMLAAFLGLAVGSLLDRDGQAGARAGFRAMREMLASSGAAMVSANHEMTAGTHDHDGKGR